ncbi:MAG: tRNA pseudouridine(38-40) synthase TruA [Chlorobi bacterium]|nr:tRNA pseudouridine(38-40) synthase TruA [Chlorobiota bacterium]
MSEPPQPNPETRPPRRIALLLAYDGTDFHGWQRQPNGRSVQQTVEEMLTQLCSGVPVTVVGSGRTDAGVHANYQVAHADVATQLGDAQLLHALGRMAPNDLAIRGLRSVPGDFHARFHAFRRTYRYRIITAPNPFLARYAYRYDALLNIDALHQTAPLLLGQHDFTTLSKHNPDTPNPVCAVERSEWREVEGGMEFWVSSNRFLYGMVRLLVGIQLEVARGKRRAQEIPEIILLRDRARQGMAAPALGLSLVNVEYPAQIFTATA